ncbi:acetoacetate decarboxylase family protein [Streptomyces sp. NPDC001591]|uniref:acetoacetate decarboxylase family protein n=1 Tax=Streptomyces sp. NPDC001591 TaxID=3364589 RepID=UPI0036909C94
MDRPTDPPLTAYPPAPWHSRAQMWSALVTAERPVAAPLPPVLGSRTLLAMVIRYQEGTLTYDEFVLASLRRHGRRAGVWTHHIWVDSAASLWGGRQIWGLPKQMATFTWSGPHLRVNDAQGLLAALTLTPRGRRGLPVSLQLGGFGHTDTVLQHCTARIQGHLQPARIHIDQWSKRLPRITQTTPRLALTVAPARLSVLAPTRLGVLSIPRAGTRSGD